MIFFFQNGKKMVEKKWLNNGQARTTSTILLLQSSFLCTFPDHILEGKAKDLDL